MISVLKKAVEFFLFGLVIFIEPSFKVRPFHLRCYWIWMYQTQRGRRREESTLQLFRTTLSLTYDVKIDKAC